MDGDSIRLWTPTVTVNGVANVCNRGSLEEQTKQLEYLNMINSYPILLIQTKIYYIFLIEGTSYLVKSGAKALCLPSPMLSKKQKLC